MCGVVSDWVLLARKQIVNAEMRFYYVLRRVQDEKNKANTHYTCWQISHEGVKQENIYLLAHSSLLSRKPARVSPRGSHRDESTTKPTHKQNCHAYNPTRVWHRRDEKRLVASLIRPTTNFGSAHQPMRWGLPWVETNVEFGQMHARAAQNKEIIFQWSAVAVLVFFIAADGIRRPARIKRIRISENRFPQWT